MSHSNSVAIWYVGGWIHVSGVLYGVSGAFDADLYRVGLRNAPIGIAPGQTTSWPQQK
jgi:hypothetical protein